MSIDIQKQIRDNSTSVQEYFQDLVRWTDDQDKKERRRILGKDAARANAAGLPGPTLAPTSRSPTAPAKEATSATNGGKKTKVSFAAGDEPVTDKGDKNEEAIARDKIPMPQYYDNWDRYDVDGELDKLEQEASDLQRKEKEARQAEKDRILDELAINSAGDRSRTSSARPRVKISVRTSGRRASPVDLAMPKKEEANKLFASQCFRDAIAMYTSALDLLDKYEPPAEGKENMEIGGDQQGAEDARGREGDCAGQETEALVLKATLLANRAAACFKLEEWRDTIEDCTEALRFDPGHHKATLRRGMAFSKLKRWAPAARDLTRVVAEDKEDKKAQAELKMVRRKLEEHLQESRVHARCMLMDPNRQATMPTRKLVVKVRRAERVVESHSTPVSQPRAAPSADSLPSGAADEYPGKPDEEQMPAPALAARQPYVPRSVRIRGRQNAGAAQAATASAGAGSASANNSRSATGYGQGGSGAMSFYAFEKQWTQMRNAPRERAQLLRRVGAASLPLLLRESLDAELLASLLEVLRVDVGTTLEVGSAEAQFATDALAALARTPRFDLSIAGLSEAEHVSCSELFATLEGAGAAEPISARVAELRQAFTAPPRKPRQPAVRSTRGAAVGVEAIQESPVEAVSGVRRFRFDDAEPSVQAPLSCVPPPPDVPVQAFSEDFSLDGCD